jgi:hypothetical protein
MVRGREAAAPLCLAEIPLITLDLPALTAILSQTHSEPSLALRVRLSQRERKETQKNRTR